MFYPYAVKSFIYHFFTAAIISFGFVQNAYTKTLKTASLLYPQDPQLIFGWESDLFVDPLETKGAAFKAYQLDVAYPVISSTEWKPLLAMKAESTSIAQQGLTIGNQRILINKALLDRGVGVGLLKMMNDEGYLKFVAIYGSASEKPFQDTRDIDLDLNLQYISSLQNDGQWIFILSSTKNRGYLNNKIVPLLGYRYFFNTEMNVTLGLGFFETQWYPTSTESLVLLLEPVGYSLSYSKHLPLDLLWVNQLGLSTKSFMHTDRIEDEMRLFLEYKYMKSGFELTITERSRLGVDFGLIYDRTLYEAKQVFLPIGKENVFASEWFGSFTWRFKL